MTSLLEWMNDRLNPILVKEIRQAMRGRYFRGVYILTLFVTMVLGTTVLIATGDSDSSGIAFFGCIYGCLVLSVIGLLPLQAFLSVGVTWDQKSIDLLHLADLRPRQIVLGRLLSSMLQGSTVVVLLLPFLAMSYLLPGTDPVAMLLTLLGLMGCGTMMVCISLMLAWLTEERVRRVFLLAMLGMSLLSTSWTVFFIGIDFLGSSVDLSDPELHISLSLLGLLFVGVSGFCLVASTARLAHPEENRSTGLRLYICLIMFLCFLLCHLTAWRSGGDEDLVYVSLMMTLLAVMPLLGLFATEPERLGRRVQHQVPRSRLLAMLLLPLYPSGGSGVLLTLLAVLLLCLGFILFPPVSVTAVRTYHQIILSLGGYTLCGLLFSSALTSRWTGSKKGRRIAIGMIPCTILWVMLTPALLGLVFDIPEWTEMEHIGNPIFMLEQLEHGKSGASSKLMILWTGVLICLAMNAPRCFRATRRMWTLSKHNEARRAAAPT